MNKWSCQMVNYLHLQTRHACEKRALSHLISEEGQWVRGIMLRSPWHMMFMMALPLILLSSPFTPSCPGSVIPFHTLWLLLTTISVHSLFTSFHVLRSNCVFERLSFPLCHNQRWIRQSLSSWRSVSGRQVNRQLRGRLGKVGERVLLWNGDLTS